MTANTKLTREQKDQRIEWLCELKFSGGEIATAGMITVAKRPAFPGSKMAHFSVSVCSDTEQKFRRKVGEYHALRRLMEFNGNWNNGNWITLPARILASSFAYTLDCEDQVSRPF
jgi:hypothetical protein